MINIIKEHCFYVVLTLFLITCGLLWYGHKMHQSSMELREEVEYYDSLNNYNKIYYSKAFSLLKKENEELYDSLKRYKDKLDYVVQFYHEKEYNTGKNDQKPTVLKDTIHDTITVDTPLVARTYQYTSEPNDTFQYKLNVNSYTEPNWYSIQAKVRNKFTIVNKEENGMNHITIEPNNGGNVSDVTVWKKEDKTSIWDRFAVGPTVGVAYDINHKKVGATVGVGITFNLIPKKKKK